jgi:hypothetical protein
VFVDDVLQAEFFRKFSRVLFQFDLHLRAALFHFRRTDLVIVLAGRIPADRLGIRFIRVGGHPHPFGDHKHGIKSHPELTDDL